MVVAKAKPVSVLISVEVSRPPHEAERAKDRGAARKCKAVFLAILLANASLTSTIALHPLFTTRAHFC